MAADPTTWLSTRWSEILGVTIRYENDLYGVINMILVEAFPASQRFMVIPQGLLRDEYTRSIGSDEADKGSSGSGSDLEGETNPDMSYDVMTGHPVVSRQMKGHEQGKGIADFVVVKCHDEGAYNDNIVCIVEVKRSDQTELDAQDQIEYYMSTSAKSIRVNDARRQGRPHLEGFLMLGGKKNRHYVLDGHTHDSGFQETASFDSSAVHAFLTHMRRLAAGWQ